jgi:hypothetical protein
MNSHTQKTSTFTVNVVKNDLTRSSELIQKMCYSENVIDSKCDIGSKIFFGINLGRLIYILQPYYKLGFIESTVGDNDLINYNLVNAYWQTTIKISNKNTTPIDFGFAMGYVMEHIESNNIEISLHESDIRDLIKYGRIFSNYVHLQYILKNVMMKLGMSKLHFFSFRTVFPGLKYGETEYEWESIIKSLEYLRIELGRLIPKSNNNAKL